MQKQTPYVVTLLSPDLSEKMINNVVVAIKKNGFEITEKKYLSDKKITHHDCVELSIQTTDKDITTLQKDLSKVTTEEEIDIVVQEENHSRRNKNLVVFDMDSTLIQCEVMDELAKVAGAGEKVAAITQAAMRGEIPFNESFERRLATLEGLDESALQKIADKLPMAEGAERLIKNLQKLNYKIGILSGGFNYFANYLKDKYNLNYVFANQLDIVDGKMTGKVKGEIVNGEKKVEYLNQIMKQLNLNKEQTIAVGDGANDLPMLAVAGLGVAYHAKPIVKEKAKHAVSTIGLDGILYLLGIHDRDTI